MVLSFRAHDVIYLLSLTGTWGVTSQEIVLSLQRFADLVMREGDLKKRCYEAEKKKTGKIREN